MKTKDKMKSCNQEDGFKAVKFSREQKDRLSKMFAKMTKEEILDYLKQKSLERGRIKPSA